MQQQFVIYSGSFPKAAKIEILNVKTFTTAGQNQPLQILYNIDVLENFAKISRENICAEVSF